MEILGVETVLSLVLVNENIRPAFIYQYSIDDKENLKKSSNDERDIPDLFYSDNYDNYQGTIISN